MTGLVGSLDTTVQAPHDGRIASHLRRDTGRWLAVVVLALTALPAAAVAPADAGPQRVVRGTAPKAPRTARLTTPMCGFTRQCASSAQSDASSDPLHCVSAIGPSTASMMSARLMSLRASVNPPPAPRTLFSRPAAESFPTSFCAVGRGTPVSSARMVADSRSPSARRAAADPNPPFFDRGPGYARLSGGVAAADVDWL